MSLSGRKAPRIPGESNCCLSGARGAGWEPCVMIAMDAIVRLSCDGRRAAQGQEACLRAHPDRRDEVCAATERCTPRHRVAKIALQEGPLPAALPPLLRSPSSPLHPTTSPSAREPLSPPSDAYSSDAVTAVVLTYYYYQSPCLACTGSFACRARISQSPLSTVLERNLPHI